MTCESIRERLTALHDGELPQDEADAAARHVAGCPECAAELERLEETVSRLGAWEIEPLPSRSAGETADRLLAETRAARVNGGEFPLRLWVAAGLAGAVLGFLVGLAALRPPAPPPEKTRESVVPALHPLPFDISLVAVEAPEEGR
ncbi:MAG: anti-sigma factor family protein [Planctomycetota bacterium]